MFDRLRYKLGRLAALWLYAVALLAFAGWFFTIEDNGGFAWFAFALTCAGLTHAWLNTKLNL
jgi:hypothetical protein